MKGLLILFGVLFGLFLVLAVLAVSTFAATPEETAVAEVIKAWDKAYIDTDMATLASLLTDDATIESTVLKKTLTKSAYLAETEKDLKSNGRSRSFRVLDLKVVISGDQAKTVKKFEVTVQGSFSSPNRGIAWTGTYVTENKLRLEGGVWKIYFQKTYRAS